ncbi:NAD-dependent epimerase/dehydratase family protein [Lentibacillus saliphilus]|uniref:NAD-dependent epimerase/dehydratase family protein n=1 Tax=Lentibacillus saliphilus TaxID=2737028 RepID=UPI001C301063|nr:NAD-dependent epimerase/dehydratase family protein [Lentibacillus saliphilus]
MNVIVTGGAGFIGSIVCDELINEGYKPIVVDKTAMTTYDHHYRLDICDPGLKAVFIKHRPKYVIHLAAQVDVQQSIQDPLNDAQMNVMGLLNVLESCRLAGVEKIVFASSAAVYGAPKTEKMAEDHPIQPLSPYGVTKYTGELYLQTFASLHGLPYTILRFANVYGVREPHDETGVVAAFMNQFLRGERPIIYGDGEQTRDFVYVRDVARASVLSLKKAENTILNVSTAEPVKVNELYTYLAELLGIHVTPRYTNEKVGDIKQSVLANALIQKTLNWTPAYDLRAGLHHMRLNYETQYDRRHLSGGA